MPDQVNAEQQWGGLGTAELTAAGLVSIRFRGVTISEPYGRLWMARRFVQLSRPLVAGENVNIVYIQSEGIGRAAVRYEQTDAIGVGKQTIGPSALITGPNPYVAASQYQIDVETRNSSVLSAITATIQVWCAPMIPVTPLPRGRHG